MVLAAVVVAAGEFAAGPADPATRWLDAFAGAAFLAVGVASAGRSWRHAALALAAGVAWFAGGVSEPALWIHRPLMLHVALAYPDGRLRGPLARTVVGAAWVSAIAPAVARSTGASLLLAGGAAVAGWWMARAAPLGRRAAARVAARGVAVLALSLAVPATGRLLWPDLGDGFLLVDLYSGLVATAGLVLLTGPLLQPDALETDVVIELTKQDNPEETLEALRREVAARDAPASRAAIATAAGLLESNLALHADLAEKVEEVRASRRRLVEAAVVERHRLEQRLADGAVRYLDELASVLHALHALHDGNGGQAHERSELTGRCLAEVSRTRADLGQLGRGLHPRALADYGLPVALAEVAERSPVPTSLEVPDARFPMIVEATVWYACAEAMANVAKYAHARTAEIVVRVEGADLVACVRDDGVGGAQFRPTGGLAGLADRLSAVDGEVEVTSPAGGGTRLRIRVPF
jgi:signal transduction histidine kinase